MTHKLGLKVEPTSTAVWKFWELKYGPIKSYVEQENYTIRFTFKNLGSQRFPSGKATMSIVWPNGISVIWPLTIPELEIGQANYAAFSDGSIIHQGDIISTGYGLIFCNEISSRDQQDVVITDLDGISPYSVGGGSIYSIPAKAWTDIYAKYSMVVSAAGLAIVALDKIIAFMAGLISRLLQTLLTGN